MSAAEFAEWAASLDDLDEPFELAARGLSGALRVVTRRLSSDVEVGP